MDKEIMIGYLKGYNICKVSKKDIEKDKFVEDLETSIKEEILKTFEKKGYVYGLKKGKVLKVVYLFDSNEIEGKVNLTFTKSYYSKDVEDREEDFDNAFLEAMKDKLILEEFSKITWKDNEIQVENKEEDDDENMVTIALPLCMCLGMGLGFVFDNVLFGIVIGFAVGTLLGLIKNKK